MREDRNGRSSLPLWGEPPGALAVADAVRAVTNDWPGDVVSVDYERQTFTVQWQAGPRPVVYPMGSPMVRRAFPWEK